MVRSQPWQSKFVNSKELAYIKGQDQGTDSKSQEFGDMGWLDKLIKLRDVKPLDTNKKF